MAYKITHERDNCIGCGACVATCPDFWEMNEEDHKSHLKNSIKGEGEIYTLEVEDLACNQEAADGCPVQCIKVEN